MIRTLLTGVGWDVSPLPDGVQIDLVEQAANTVFHVPFSGAPLIDLIDSMVDKMPEEMRAQLAAKINPKLRPGGIVTPGDNGFPGGAGNLPFKGGPQG